MTYDEFVAKYNNKYEDYDGYYGYQCMDLYRQYVKEVLQAPQSPSVTGAKDVWNTYRKDVFERISNSPINFPQKGDVVIWNKPAGGGYGHIAICDWADSMKFNSFDQNWGPNLKCHIQAHNYTNVLGWLRPKKKIDNVGIASDIVDTSIGQAPTTPENTPVAPIETEPDSVVESPTDDDSGVTSDVGTGDSIPSGENIPRGDNTTVPLDSDVVGDDGTFPEQKTTSFIQTLKTFFSNLLSFFKRKEG